MVSEVSARQIAVSGLKAQRARMNVIANNISNAYATRTPDGGPYRREMVILSGDQLNPHINPGKLGVRVDEVREDMSPFRVVHEPGHPDANADGYVSYPNVSMAVEMVDLVAAQRAYDANVAVFASGRHMARKALEIIQA